jgi:putative radical SAM enzyme (TIGR03279 family)
MPAGCRKSLYVKDDDYRASFLYGNFVTLSALTQEDWDRIFRQRLSPLYVSVHSTDPELRAFLLGNKKTPPIMDSLKKLAEGGIKMHTQIVLCPGINDGPHLTRTVSDLASLFPKVSSIAVVPVGVTEFRKKLFGMRTFSSRAARTVIEQLKPLMRRFKRQFGTSLIFPADEFYIKAKEPLPPSSFYEDFPQIENGVGMVAAFLKETARTKIPSTIAPAAVTVITGVSFSGILDHVLDRLRAVKGITIKKVALKNRFFGPSVTVTGLLTGQDIIAALKGKRLGDMVLIPANVLREDDNVFLDGMTLEQVQEHLRTTVIKVDSFRDVVEILKARGRG